MADVPLIPELSTTLTVPHVAQDDHWDTTLMLCNPNITETSLTVTFYSRTGKEAPIQWRTIPAQGSAKLHVGDMLPDPAYGPPGSIHIHSTRRIAGFTVYDNLKSGGKCHAGVALTE